MSYQIFRPGNRYEFSVYANSILGSNFKGAKLVDILSFESANEKEAIAHKSAQVYPNLPKGSPSDPTRYIYYRFELNGEYFILADLWIISDTIRSVEGLDYTLTLKDITPDDVAMITAQLNLMGIDFTIQ